ncbi:hypothetical protein [Streptacidiphilus sp. EB103A]|uniref:hypothetical protein n=1 Tax=Streptacidiphilus sp. EB103A TaxID=3156275 RepID=UPI0035111074
MDYRYRGFYGTAYRHALPAVAPLAQSGVPETVIGWNWLRALSALAADRRRLAAGKALAQEGKITAVYVEPGTITAFLSTHIPFGQRVQIHVPLLGEPKWSQLSSLARSRAHVLADRSAQDALAEIIKIGESRSLYLLPELTDIETWCDCRSRKGICDHASAALHHFARCLDVEPFTLLLLNGRSGADFFAGVDDPEHRSLQPNYHPPTLPEHRTDAFEVYSRWMFNTPPPLPPLPRAPGPLIPDGLPAGTDPAARLLAAGAADRAADILRAALRSPGRPLTDATQQLTPRRDRERLASLPEAPASAAEPSS